MNDLDKAKQLLVQNGYTCVLCKEDSVFYSNQRGVKPLIEFFDSGEDFCGFCAADKTIGAGAAHIYVLLGIRAAWANIISRDAEEILKKNRIFVGCENKVPYIINRAGDGRCPIENCVQGISDSKEALRLIRKLIK